MIHIGAEIRRIVKEQKCTSAWLARQLNCSRTKVYNIYSQQSIDTNTLRQISTILNVDLFLILSQDFAKSHS